MSGNGKALHGSGGDPLYPSNLSHAHEKDIIKDLTPQQVALFAAMLVNGGKITPAAKQVGMNPSYARRLVSKHAVFRDAIRQYGDGMRTCLQDWMDLVPQAKAAMVALLNDEDGKVRYLAAKDIIDRAEGKAVNRVDLNLRDERPQLSEGEVQLAFSLMKSRGISYPEAVQLIKQNPEDAAEWISRNAVATEVGNGKALPPSDPEAQEDAAALPDPVDSWDQLRDTEEDEEG